MPQMRKAIVAMTVASLLVLAGAGITRAADSTGFTNRAFNGVYAFTLHGTTIDNPNQPMAGGGILNADGAGGLSGSLNANVGGAICTSTLAETYKVNANGTGTATLTASGCPSAPADYDLVLVRPWQVDMFSTDSGSVVGLSAHRRRADIR